MDRRAWWATVHRIAKSGHAWMAAHTENALGCFPCSRKDNFTLVTFACMCMLSLQSFLTFCDPMHYGPPDSSVHWQVGSLPFACQLNHFSYI